MRRERAAIERLDQPAGVWTLWFVLLAGPVAWILGLSLDYALVQVACTSGTVAALHAVTVGTLALAIAGGVLGRREWRALGERWSPEAGGRLARSRFMVVVGLMASALFGLVIVAQWVTKLFLHPCMGI